MCPFNNSNQCSAATRQLPVSLLKERHPKEKNRIYLRVICTPLEFGLRVFKKSNVKIFVKNPMPFMVYNYSRYFTIGLHV